MMITNNIISEHLKCSWWLFYLIIDIKRLLNAQFYIQLKVRLFLKNTRREWTLTRVLAWCFLKTGCLLASIISTSKSNYFGKYLLILNKIFLELKFFWNIYLDLALSIYLMIECS